MNNEFNNENINQIQNNNINNKYSNNYNNLNNQNDKWKDTVIFVLVIIVFILTALSLYFVIDKKDNDLDNNKENNQLENGNSNLKEDNSNIDSDKNTEQEKKDENSNLNNEINDSRNENNYKVFSDNLNEEVSKYSEGKMQKQSVQTEVGSVKLYYSVTLESNGDLYVEYHNDDVLKQKYGKYKIAENILTFYIARIRGNCGENGLYFINQDGTVGLAEVEFNTCGSGDINKLNIKRDLGYKNIVSVINGNVFLGHGGYEIPMFIDINGKIHS